MFFLGGKKLTVFFFPFSGHPRLRRVHQASPGEPALRPPAGHLRPQRRGLLRHLNPTQLRSHQALRGQIASLLLLLRMMAVPTRHIPHVSSVHVLNTTRTPVSTYV